MSAGRWGWGVSSWLSCFQTQPPHTWDKTVFFFSLSIYHHCPPWGTLAQGHGPWWHLPPLALYQDPKLSNKTLGWETEARNFVILETYLLLKYSKVFLFFFNWMGKNWLSIAKTSDCWWWHLCPVFHSDFRWKNQHFWNTTCRTSPILQSLSEKESWCSWVGFGTVCTGLMASLSSEVFPFKSYFIFCITYSRTLALDSCLIFVAASKVRLFFFCCCCCFSQTSK